MSNIHIMTTGNNYARTINKCRTCGQRRRIVVTLCYDTTYARCCACGRDPRERKQKPNARRAAVAREDWLAGRTWKQAFETMMEATL